MKRKKWKKNERKKNQVYFILHHFVVVAGFFLLFSSFLLLKLFSKNSIDLLILNDLSNVHSSTKQIAWIARAIPFIFITSIFGWVHWNGTTMARRMRYKRKEKLWKHHLAFEKSNETTKRGKKTWRKNCVTKQKKNEIEFNTQTNRCSMLIIYW